MKASFLIGVLHLIAGIGCCVFMLFMPMSEHSTGITRERFVHATVWCASVAVAVSGCGAFKAGHFHVRYAFIFASSFFAVTLFLVTFLVVSRIGIPGLVEGVMWWLVLTASMFGASCLAGFVGRAISK